MSPFFWVLIGFWGGFVTAGVALVLDIRRGVFNTDKSGP